MRATHSSWLVLLASIGTLVFILGLAVGCSSSDKTRKAPPESTPESSPSQSDSEDRTDTSAEDRETETADEDEPQRKAQPEPVKVLRVSRVRRRLEDAAEDWMGVPYEWGGESKQGIDCSALVQTLYDEAFDRRLPRVTEFQVQAGSTVTRQQLRPGDLVFFHPGNDGNHVGVYVGDRQFIHASSSDGVTRTRFDDYWQRYYWTSRRVLGPSELPDSLAPRLVAYRSPDTAGQSPRRRGLAGRTSDETPEAVPPADDEALPAPDTTGISTETTPAPDEADDRVQIAARSDTTAIPSCADPDVHCGSQGGEGAFGDTTFVSPDSTERMGW